MSHWSDEFLKDVPWESREGENTVYAFSIPNNFWIAFVISF